MNIIKRISNRLKSALNKHHYEVATEKVLNTPPLARGKTPFIALSMVHQRDVFSYLVAIKSFSRFANPEQIVIVCDPSITDHERAIFKTQIPHCELRNAEEFRHQNLPVGGCWERLSAITTYTPEQYVVQLDADTVTTNNIEEVLNGVKNKSGFVLGEEPNQRIVTLEETSTRAKPWIDPTVHIQGLAEFLMASANLNHTYYARGCAGFTGFPKTKNMREELIDFSRKMASATGDRWSEWGTEQVASNYLVANANATEILPFPKYCTPNKADQNTAFLHFIGSMRFTDRNYEKASSEIISSLQ